MDFSSLRILVVGDLMIDRYLYGRVDRISPEAPVPVVRLGKEENRLGGAANVALNILALGAEPVLAGVVGQDENGTLVRQLLAEAGMRDNGIVSDTNRPTTVKTRLVSGGQQLMRVDREETFSLHEEVHVRLVETIAREIAIGLDLILFQDYNKGVLTPRLIDRVQSLADQVNCSWGSVVDPKFENFLAYKKCGVFKPNLKEIRQQVPFAIEPNLSDLDRAASYLFEHLQCRAVMITLSERGIYLHDGNQSSIYPTDVRKVRDVSGAGDTVIAVVACGLAANMDLSNIAKLANLAGGQVVGKSGVVPVDKDDLDKKWRLQFT